MKKSILLGIIGVGAVASTALGQGIVVGNYTGDSGFIGAPITYAGQTVGSGFSGEFYYSIGAGALAPLPETIQAFNGTLGGVPTTDLSGYYTAFLVSIPGWTSGAVNLQWDVFNTVAIGGNAPGTITGQSAIFTMVPVTDPSPSHPDMSTAIGYSAFTVSAVPEPTTLALAGLGALTSLVAFRRKQS